MANKITQKSTLERVYRTTKTKDKTISRIVKEKLDRINAAEQEPLKLLEQQKSICLNLESLGNKGLWERDKKQFDSICQQWTILETKASDEIKKRFENALLRFQNAF